MSITVTTPIVADLGKTHEESVTQLRRGVGQLINDVEEVMKRVRLRVDADGGNRVFVPIVVIYTEADTM